MNQQEWGVHIRPSVPHDRVNVLRKSVRKVAASLTETVKWGNGSWVGVKNERDVVQACESHP